MYNINRVGNNITSTEEYEVANIDTSTYAASGLTLVGTMYYSFDSNGKQFRKKFVSADGTEQKYVYEYRDDKNVAVQLPGGAISQAKNDSFGRKVFDELQLGTGFVSRKFDYIEGAITDAHKSNGKVKSPATTQLVSRITLSDGRTVSYEYDAEERITKVTDSLEGTTEYTYDALGQLLTEKVNDTVKNSMSYDGYGNIRTKNGKAYTYGNSVWKDLLTSYGGQAISYDAQGNPTSYLGHTLTWEKGRQLKSFDSNAYTYNASGIRMTKTVGGVKHTYTLDGTKIIREVWGSNTLFPLYGVDDSVCGINYNGNYYYFAKNLQGDIIAIVDKDAKTVARYSYDAWGVPTVVSDSSGRSIATVNPFRYRGYYYDAEIGMYYLQSRYYNPVVGRFINIDTVDALREVNKILDKNLFAYCQNTPINEFDYDGCTIVTVIRKIIVGILKGFISTLFGDVLTYLFSLLFVDKNAKFKMSSAADYLLSIAFSVALEFVDIIGNAAIAIGIFQLVTPYLIKIIKGDFKGSDFAKLMFEALLLIVRLVIMNKIRGRQKTELNKIKKCKKSKRNIQAKAQRNQIRIKYKKFEFKIDLIIEIRTVMLTAFFEAIFLS